MSQNKREDRREDRREERREGDESWSRVMIADGKIAAESAAALQ